MLLNGLHSDLQVDVTALMTSMFKLNDDNLLIVKTDISQAEFQMISWNLQDRVKVKQNWYVVMSSVNQAYNILNQGKECNFL